jgi:hypothetical protein
MAVKRNEAGSKLILQVETGVNAKGTVTCSPRTFAHINPELADEDAMQIATELGTLQKHVVHSVNRQDAAQLGQA